MFSVAMQVNQFLEFKNSNRELREEKFWGAVYSINVGENDVNLVFLSKPRLLGFVTHRADFCGALAPLKPAAAIAIRAIVPQSGHDASTDQFHLDIGTSRREERSPSSALMLRI